MTFKAVREGDGALIISADFLSPDWKVEKKRAKKGEVKYLCSVCHEPVTLATSHRDTQFFKHLPGSNCPNSQGESLEHARLKSAVYKLCKSLGWDTDIEVAGPDWRADVLATDGTRKVAFEVQLSGITGETLVERSEKYKRDGITSVWLLKKFPKRCPLERPWNRFRIYSWCVNWNIPSHITSTDLTAFQVETYFLKCEEKYWSISETIVYWNNLGAILAEFDEDDPDHQMMILKRKPATLISVVTQALGGEIDLAFQNSLSYSDQIFSRLNYESYDSDYTQFKWLKKAREWLQAREKKDEEEQARRKETARLFQESLQETRRLEDERRIKSQVTPPEPADPIPEPEPEPDIVDVAGTARRVDPATLTDIFRLNTPGVFFVEEVR